MSEDTVPFTTFRNRLATAADLPRLAELINAAFSIEEFLEGTRTDLDHLAASLERGSILVLEQDGGSLLGSIYAELRGARGYLGMLAVDPSRQGQGLARRLMEAAEEYLRALGCQVIDITVLSLRPELLPLYRRFGFVETGTEEFSYPRKFRTGAECHCIAMSKPL